MMSCRVVSLGLCVLPWMLDPALADTHERSHSSAKGSFAFSVTQAAPLAAAPQVPVDRSPLSGKPAVKSVEVAAADDDDTAGKTKRQHDEDAAAAGLHVAPRAEVAEAPADRPAETAPVQAAPTQSTPAYTPMPADLDALLNGVNRAKDAGPQVRPREPGTIAVVPAEPVPLVPAAPAVSPPQDATPAVPPPPQYAAPPPAQYAAPPPQYVPQAPPPPPPQYVVVPSYPAPLIVVQPMPYPPPQYAPPPVAIYAAPPPPPPPPPVQVYGAVAGAVPYVVLPPGAYRMAYGRPAWRGSRWDYR